MNEEIEQYIEDLALAIDDASDEDKYPEAHTRLTSLVGELLGEE